MRVLIYQNPIFKYLYSVIVRYCDKIRQFYREMRKFFIIFVKQLRESACFQEKSRINWQ